MVLSCNFFFLCVYDFYQNYWSGIYKPVTFIIRNFILSSIRSFFVLNYLYRLRKKNVNLSKIKEQY